MKIFKYILLIVISLMTINAYSQADITIEYDRGSQYNDTTEYTVVLIVTAENGYHLTNYGLDTEIALKEVNKCFSMDGKILPVIREKFSYGYVTTEPKKGKYKCMYFHNYFYTIRTTHKATKKLLFDFTIFPYKGNTRVKQSGQFSFYIDPNEKHDRVKYLTIHSNISS